MTDRQKEVLEHLFDLADGYYNEKTEDGSYIVSENQSARDFIQEVFVLTGELLNKFDEQEQKEEKLNNYLIVYYNRFANETQTYKVTAKNAFRAGRLFYKEKNRKAYHDCIEMIEEI
ncbi:hypothetical protein [Priestia megaterium]|uniref:hypothetical protein n=1 Tax=Priestia megaterium TaxID=1404 RepID=UPI001129C060|nr:hypothetical protein [Priestia megaterium]TPF18030.1 hypothetical protein CBE78_02045 [Priestia megaterium]TPF22137.1 hypothetical protein CBE79_04550 [Priestia megaterium]